MYRLASFLTALWMSSAAAHPGFFTDTAAGVKSVATGTKNLVTNEVQAGLDPAGKYLGFIAGSLCSSVKPLFGVTYDNYDNEKPDMSKLTLVMVTSAKTVTYKLTQAAQEIPKDNWIDPTLPLVIYFHGFTDDPSKDGFQTMNSAFASQEITLGKVNILALDASSLIKFFYLRASTMVQFIGERVAQILAAFVLSDGMDPAKIHLIGHSLGAQISGFVGQKFQKLTGGSKIGRISGLDPAGPCFSDLKCIQKLSKGDATFVDVIHSDAGVYGINEQSGHVDYYPNEGSEQPGCLIQTCSHSRSWELYAESVRNPTAFPAVKCNSSYDFRQGNYDYNDMSYMGYGSSPNSTGKYYLQTFGDEPYGAGEQGMTYKPNGLLRGVTNALKDTWTHIFMG